MKVLFTEKALQELAYFEKNRPDLVEKIKALIANIKETPYQGIGKPEALKHNFMGYWSRRINLEHRLVYKIENDSIIVIQCKGHY